MKDKELKNKSLRDRYEEICMEYVYDFVTKHGYLGLDQNLKDNWVAGDIGTIICIGDMFVDFEVIRYDIDNNIPEDKFEKWYWSAVECYDSNKFTMNYKTYCRCNPLNDKKK